MRLSILPCAVLVLAFLLIIKVNGVPAEEKSFDTTEVCQDLLCVKERRSKEREKERKDMKDFSVVLDEAFGALCRQENFPHTFWDKRAEKCVALQGGP